MEAGLKYEGHDHKAMAERCYRINDQLELFSQEATKFTDKDMVRKVIFRALKISARVEFVRKGGLDKSSESDVLDVLEEVSLTLETIHKLKRNYDSDDSSRDRSSDEEKEEYSDSDDEESDSGFENRCRIHGDHEWKDCPDNKFSRNYRKRDGEDDSHKEDDSKSSESSTTRRKHRLR